MADTVSYRPKASEIPTQPGVYRFRDANRRVLYVGKAKNLRARLSNYFAPLQNLHERTRRMVTTASSVEWTVVGTEFEALQLEFTWIKEFDPPFNVQFKDDKSYPYLAITLGDDVPRVLVTRNKNLPGARYFGPYTKVWAIRETVDLMLKAFPMRSCSDATYKRAEQTGRPCLLGDIGKCAAPCVGRISKEDHKSIALDFASFMAGQDSRYVAELGRRMKQAAETQDYESAARYRDQLAALETVLSKNTIVLADNVDADVFGIAHDELAAAVQLFKVRGGRIRGVRSWVVDKELDVDLGELVESVLRNAYEGDEVPARQVIVPVMPEDSAELEHWLASLKWERTGNAGRISLRVAQRGDVAALAQTVDTNAKNALMLYKTRRTSDFTARSQALADIQEALGMEEAPLRMECFDVSHLSGTNIVASMVVFEDGLPRKDQYRRFSIPASADDTDSIYQTLSRRLARMDPSTSSGTEADLLAGQPPLPELVEGGEATVPELVEGLVTEPAKRRFAYRPNLLIVDGGQPQVQAAARALREAGVTGIQLCGIAKRLEEVWLPDSDYPVILPRNSDAMFLIQRIRDEAHRFAISYQRQRRKKDITSMLGEVPGVGPNRVRELLRHFGSVTRLRAATPLEIAQVKGIGVVTAETIHRALRD
ncbi:MAG TPA: excinuclease ABC subunit UvrC [Homoserinimonas sp.]|nr:excinuclease ABC subunit UvrC [Homoserinimonas sp.]